jgi:hypothetical protein
MQYHSTMQLFKRLFSACAAAAIATAVKEIGTVLLLYCLQASALTTL